MRLLQVNCTDMPGSFNGYMLNMELRKAGIEAQLKVLDKCGLDEDPGVSVLKRDFVLHQILRWAEDKYSVSNLLYPYGEAFLSSKAFQEADIIHYHILHRFMFSLFDYPALMNTKRTVWTIHDPWIVTGNCVHPLYCEKWKTGCGGCERLQECGFEMRCDNTSLMWEIKHKMLKQINPHIVVASKFMEDYLHRSPITCHFRKIHRIPFGVRLELYDSKRIDGIRQKYGILNNQILVGFRADNNPIKGCRYIFEALSGLQDRDKIVLAVVGGGEIREDIRTMYNVVELGWLNNDAEIAEYMLMCDIFLMPSLAESFGYMALEAMAAETPVISFAGTVLEEITDAPKCGLAVAYRSSGALKEALSFLIMNEGARREMGRAGRQRVEQEYLFQEYVRKHKELYEEILEEENGK